MPSFQARIFNPIVRLIVKRHSWGRDEFELAQRARRIFGTPKPFQWLATRSVNLSTIDDDGVSGEWLESKNHEPSAAILYIHGGGFVACSPATHRPVTAALARMTHFPVFAPSYRLAPEHRFPAGLDDVCSAYHWLIRQFPSRNVVVAGDSAGGGLALSLMLRLRDEKVPMPVCAVCFSPWSDLTGSGASVRANAEKDAMFYAETEEQFAAAYISERSDLFSVSASPVFAEFNGVPPVLFQVGSGEILVDDSRRIFDKIRAAGGTGELEIYDGVFHVWQMAIGLIPEARQSLESASRFIRQHVASHADRPVSR